MFERPVVFDDLAGGAAGRIDLYRRACFVDEIDIDRLRAIMVPTGELKRNGR